MAYSGKWHLFAAAACFAAWTGIRGKPTVLLFVFAGLILFFIIRSSYRLACALCAVFLIVWLDCHYFQNNRTRFSGNESVFWGEIDDIPVIDGRDLTFTLLSREKEKLQVKGQITSKRMQRRLAAGLKVGMTCRLAGRLSVPGSPTNFHSFDNRDYLLHRHIHWILNLKSPPACRDGDLSFVNRLKRVREAQMDRVRNLFSPSAGGMINALVFGEESGLPPDLVNSYQTLGIIHLLAVSGMHVVLIFGCLYIIGLRIGIVKEYLILFLILCLPLYVVLTGSAPSIIRAGLTASFFLAGALLKRRRLLSTDALGLACCLMIFYDPHVLFDLGFQLSFAVTFMILVSGPVIAKHYASGITRAFWLSVVSQLASFPIIVFHFYQLSLLSFFLNLLFIPYMTFIIMPAAFLGFFACLICREAVPLFSDVLDFLLYHPHRLLLYLYRHPAFLLNYGSLSPLMLSVALALIYAILCFWEKYKGWRSSVLLAGSFLIIYWFDCLAGGLNPYGSVTFLDVGQGDSILINMPHQKGTVLIDTGGIIPYKQDNWEKKKKPFEVGRDVVLHEIRAMGIRSIDTIVLTHRDFDHIGGMQGLIGQIPIKRIAISPYFDPSPADLKMFEKAIRAGTKIIRISAGDVLNFKNGQFKVLSPSVRSDSNDNSIVLQTVIGGKRWLFTGDLEKKGEDALLKRDAGLATDILKVGHHGSKTSTSKEWLKQLRPALAVISVGRFNHYGHPNPEVIQRLKSRHVRIFRTDKQGAVQFVFANSRIVAIKTAVH